MGSANPRNSADDRLEITTPQGEGEGQMKEIQGRMEMAGMTLYVLRDNGDNKFSLNLQPGCNCAKCSPGALHGTAFVDIGQHITKIWNAANGMPTEEAVKYITHGREMESVLKETLQILFRDTACPDAHSKIWQLITKLEAR